MDSGFLTPYDHTDREPAVITNTISELRRLVLHFHEIDPFENTRTRSPAQGSTRSATAQRATQAPPQPVISARINVSVRPPSAIMSTQPTSFQAYCVSYPGESAMLHIKLRGQAIEYRARWDQGQRFPEISSPVQGTWLQTMPQGPTGSFLISMNVRMLWKHDGIYNLPASVSKIRAED